MADELVDIFDENNKPLNIQIMKSEAHAKGLWHRSIHIWIYNSNREVMLQLRAKDKDLFPDRWDVSVAGHVAAGEEIISSAIREIKEEIGLDVNPEDLMLYKHKKFQIVSGRIINKEYIYIYLLKYNGEISSLKIQEEEVQKVGLFSAEYVKKDYNTHPEKYTPGKEYWLEIMDCIIKKI